jgi:anti-sigma B factor antagonist
MSRSMGAPGGQDADEFRAARLGISADRYPGEAIVLVLEGELDISTCPAVFDRIAAWRGREPELRLDLSRISFIDSQGLHLLLEVTAPSADGTPPVVLLSPSEQVRQVVKVTGTSARLGL